MQLYLGLDPSQYPDAIHYPVIRTELLFSDQIGLAKDVFSQFTHSIFTSKSCVRYWFELGGLATPITIAIGKATAHELKVRGVSPLVSEIETQEGIVELLNQFSLEGAYIFYPHSKRARSVLSDYLKSKNIRFFSFDLYDTQLQKLEPIPSLESIDEIIFTSPSSVEGFIQIFGRIPQDKKLTCIGPVTRAKVVI